MKEEDSHNQQQAPWARTKSLGLPVYAVFVAGSACPWTHNGHHRSATQEVCVERRKAVELSAAVGKAALFISKP